MKKKIYLIVVAFFVLGFSKLYSQCTTSTVFKGQGTYYGYGGGGNCSYPFPYTNMHTAALNQSQYAGSKLCGACALVTGERGSITVSIQDQCPECKFGDLDLSQKAFPLIADPIKGRVPISWKIVPCPVTGNIAFYIKEGSSQWWTAVQVRNHRYPISKFEYKLNGKYIILNREAYNYFVAYSGMGVGPYTFRITDYYGRVIEETNIPLKVTTQINGTKQFASCPTTISASKDVVTLEQQVLLYPNPTINGQINLINNSSEIFQFTIVDALGRFVKTGRLATFSTIPLNLKAKATYFIQLRSNTQIINKKIINN